MTIPSFTYYHFVMIVKSKRWKKLTYSILTALGIGMLTSCYGMPVSADYDIRGISCICGKVINSNGDPISGIRVYFDYNGIQYETNTLENGSYFIEIKIDDNSVIREVKVHFEDVDEEENGRYSNHTESIELDEYGYCDRDVTLDEIQS